MNSTIPAPSTDVCCKCESQGPFHQHRRGRPICKACTLRSIHACRTRDAAHLLAYRWYNAQRRRGIKETRQQPQVVERILRQCQFKSVISGETDMRKLCVAPYFRNLPSEPEWNCVIVTRKEAQSLAHMKSEEAAHARFPAHVRQQIMQSCGSQSM